MSSKAENRRSRKQKVKGPVSKFTMQNIETLDMDSRLALICELIPIGLAAVAKELQDEVTQLAGQKSQRKTDANCPSRYGSNPGTVKMLGQKVPIQVPRVRGKDGEIPLQSYGRLHQGKDNSGQVFGRILRGLSCRDYEGAAESFAGSIGLSKSTVSREFIAASAKELRAFQERDLSSHDIVAIFMDGKTFADDVMVIALGITLTGEKVFLGFVQTDTENASVLSRFLQSLLDRGLNISKGILAVIDGAKGLSSALRSVFKGRVVIQRCQWHKRENVLKYLSKDDQKWMKTRLQNAYNQPTYDGAKKKLAQIRRDLEKRNLSATASLDEGLEDTLTLHSLGVFPLLGISFKTTNVLESINAKIEQTCAKVDNWMNSSQKQRWLAAALVDIEPRLRKVKGYNHLHHLRDALMKKLDIEKLQLASGCK